MAAMIARQSFWLGLLICITCGATQVRAQENAGLMKMGESDMSDQQARVHFKLGQTFYDSGRFREAAEEWEQAHALSKREALLYNIYVAQRDASDWPKAIDALTRYLATNEPDAAQRVNLDARLKAMKDAVAANEAKASSQPTAAPEAAPAPAPAQQPAPQPEQGSSVWPIALVVTGGALIAGSVVTGLITSGKVADIEDSCPGDSCPKGFDLEGKRDSASTLATVTDVLWISGAAFAAVGAVLWLTDGAPSAEAQVGASALLKGAVVCMPGVCGGALSGRF
jgi:tetratricopeptide (TPR) repeat protein